jgi:broad specificity phosphatase PhoE
MYLYFARHGESQANVAHVISNRDLPHPLTERGVTQSQELAEHLRARSIAAVYCSPILRARQTAAIVAGVLGIAVAVTDALREFDCGVAEGRGDAEAWALHAAVVADWRRGEHARRIEGGESLLDLRARFVPFVEQIVAEAPGDVLLIGHGGLYYATLPLVLPNIAPEFPYANGIENCAYVLAERTPAGLVCRAWCGAALALINR